MKPIRFIRSSLCKVWTATSLLRPEKILTSGSLKKKAIIGTIALSSFSYASFTYKDSSPSIASHQPKLLCVLFDAGETGGLVPVLKKLEINGKDFLVLVMGTAETIVKPGMFGNKRITLKDLSISTVVDTTTPRTCSLSIEMMEKFQKMNPAVVLVGTASRIQQDILEQFPSAVTVAFVDNLSYDPEQESFKTVKKVQEAAKHVLCPSKNIASLLLNSHSKDLQPTYHVVGKPSLEAWEKEIQSVEPETVLKTLNFTPDKPIVTFIGGYGPGYEVIDPFFKKCMEHLNEQGIQVILQPHPKMGSSKVKTTEALRVSNLVVGYNSSVILDAGILGISSLFLIPNDPRTAFKHEAIERGLISKVSSCEELMTHIRKKPKVINLREEMGIPGNSTNVISQLLTEWMDKSRNECSVKKI